MRSYDQTYHSYESGEVVAKEGKETVVATLRGVNTEPGRQDVHLAGILIDIPGTEAEYITVRIRRGEGTTGYEVASVQTFSTATKASPAVIEASDNPGEVAGQAYVLTVQQHKSTAEDTVKGAALSASV